MLGLTLALGIENSNWAGAVAPSFSPSELGANLLAWYDFTDASKVTTSGGVNVTGVIDKSTNARNLSGVNNPQWDGSKITFNGTNNYLMSTAPFMYANGKIMIYIVANISSAIGSSVIAEGSSAAGNPVYQPMAVKNTASSTDNAVFLRNDAGTTIASNIQGYSVVAYDGTKRLIRLMDDGEFITAGANGTDGTIINAFTRAGTLTLNRFSIGCLLRSAASAFLTGSISEIIICSDETNIYEIESYLARKHGLLSSLSATHPYKAVAAPVGANANTIPVITTPIVAAFNGDSITELGAEGGTGSSFSKLYNSGYIAPYLAASNGRMRTDPDLDFGASGQSTPYILTNITDMAAKEWDVAMIMAGVNDCKNEFTASRIISNLSQMYDYVAFTLDKRCVPITILSNDNWGAFSGAQITAGRAKINQVNRWIMKQSARRAGRCVSVDAYTNFSTADSPKANYTFDDIHPAPAGSWSVGESIDTQLTPYYGTGSLPTFTSGNLLLNGDMTGTSGTKDGTFTGSVADSFAATGSGGVGTRTASKVAGAQRLALDILGDGSIDTMSLGQSVSSGFASGDTVYGVAYIEIIGTPVAIYRNSLSIDVTGTGTPFLDHCYGMQIYDGSFQPGTLGGEKPIAETYLPAGKYLIITPDLALTGTGLTLNWSYTMGGRATIETAQGTVDIIGAGIFKR